MTEKNKAINPTPSTAVASDVQEIGRIVHDVFDEGLRFIIMRGPFHWCAYIGIPKDHPLAGFDYDDLSFISAHGGLTFSSLGGGFYQKESKKGEPKPWPEGYWWYGWDYGHLGDRSVYDLPSVDNRKKLHDEKDWTVQEVVDDSWDSIYEFKQVMKLAEKIKKKL